MVPSRLGKKKWIQMCSNPLREKVCLGPDTSFPRFSRFYFIVITWDLSKIKWGEETFHDSPL